MTNSSLRMDQASQPFMATASILNLISSGRLHQIFIKQTDLDIRSRLDILRHWLNLLHRLRHQIRCSLESQRNYSRRCSELSAPQAVSRMKQMLQCVALAQSSAVYLHFWQKTRARPTPLNESVLTFIPTAVRTERTRPLHRKNRLLGETVIH